MSYMRVEPVFDASVRKLCTRPYARHPRGCPNFAKCSRCPPKVGLLTDVYDLSRGSWVIWTEFDLGAHVQKMREKHPNWSAAQLECCLYWQGIARKKLALEIGKFRVLYPACTVTTTPEAMGLNVTETMSRCGIVLEWPPVNTTVLVAFAAVDKNNL